MFRLEIADNEKARFMVALLLDGHERWALRLQALIKEGKEHTNLAHAAHDTMRKAEEIYQEVHQEFQAQLEVEAQANGLAA